ncbi:MAG: dihydrodipicolinate synthase family protein [Acutalibacteraceae bacterium]
MSHEEHCEVIRFTIEKVNKRVPVIAGTGSNDTAYAIELSQEAEKLRCRRFAGSNTILQQSISTWSGKTLYRNCRQCIHSYDFIQYSFQNRMSD